MITTAQLVYKLNLQATFLEKYLNLPPYFGKDLLAKAIYVSINFDDLCSSVESDGENRGLSCLLENDKLKYLLICEVDDCNLVHALHQNIEKMALRLEELVAINITRTQLISLLYKLFGLDDESKYIIKVDELKLSWEPYFQTQSNNHFVLFSDIQVNHTPFRLIATKFKLDELSVNSLSNKAKVNCAEYTSCKDTEFHLGWLLNCTELLTDKNSNNSDSLPIQFQVDDEEYTVFGFPLCKTISLNSEATMPEVSFLVKNTIEKQKFIIDFGLQKLTLECLVIDDEHVRLPKFYHEIKKNLLSHKDACDYPIVLEPASCFFWVRPFAYVDFNENAL
jgi:hypothetical protein